MSTRGSLIDYLEPLLAETPGLEKVKFIRTVRATDGINSPTLILRTNRLEKLAVAPIKNLQGTFTLVLVSPHKNVERAEDQLDDLLAILLPSLFTHKIMWTVAEQTQYDDEHLAYDITIQSILS